MPFRLSETSLQKLEGVHPQIVKVVRLAIIRSAVDFGVSEGVRSVTRQKELYAIGRDASGKVIGKTVTKTMNSRHLSGKAVDLKAYLDGKASDDWDLYPIIADAMRSAAQELRVNLVWGAAWDRSLNLLDGSLAMEAKASTARQKARGIQNVLVDAPHFELDAKVFG